MTKIFELFIMVNGIEKKKNFRKVAKHCRRTSEGSSLSFINLKGEPLTVSCAAL